MNNQEPTTLEQIALAELKRDLKKQIDQTTEHLGKLKDLLQQLENQGSRLEDTVIAGCTTTEKTH